jgi:predicted aspartyl protease
MGFVYMRVGLSKDHAAAPRKLRLLVDTGAWYSMVRRRVLRELGVRPQWREQLFVADGRPIWRDLAEVVVHYRGKSRWTTVVFAEPRDATVIGAYTLESLTLTYDRRTGRVKEMKIIPMYANSAGSSAGA